jgi:hypothetical protein
MNEQEIKNIWQSSGNEEHLQFDKTKLILDLESDLKRFRKAIKYRDWREIGIALLMIPLFGFTAFKIPFLLSKIGAIVIVGWCILLIFRILGAKRKETILPTETYLDYLTKSRQYLLAQYKLLDTVLYWYVLPSVTGILLFFMGFDLSLFKQIFYVVIVVGVGIGTYLLNKYAVKTGILPRLKRVDGILKDLEE